MSDLDAAPLHALIRARHIPSTDKRIARALKVQRVTTAVADHVCIGLGLHPAEIYGEAWWEE